MNHMRPTPDLLGEEESFIYGALIKSQITDGSTEKTIEI
jgi:hypothetical protein